MSRTSTVRGSVASRKSFKSERLQSNEDHAKGLWSSMLDSVASGKRLPEKNILVLGGTPETQKDFLETLASDAPRRPQDRHRRKPVVANEYALGYTYQDVFDADQEDILARLSIYTLSESSLSFAPLLQPLFTSQTIPETLLVLLLDWSEPWHWVRQIRNWIVLLQSVTSSLEAASRETMEEVMKDWQQRKRGIQAYDTTGTNTGIDSSVTLPLSQGEWDEPLGLPLCVVCHGADQINTLDIEDGWKEEDFDYVLQFLRTILMKHGASLIYTSNSAPNSLPTLIHSTLGIHSSLRKQALKHNVIERDKVLIPPSWDSWGKIRVLREGFDVEGISTGWSVDIQAQPHAILGRESEDSDPDSISDKPRPSESVIEGTVLPSYESTVRNSRSSHQLNQKPRIEVSITSTQDFLASQLETITRLQAEEEKASSEAPTTAKAASPFSFNNKEHDERVNEHIGPVQVNMGGIQVDADDMLKNLKNRERDNLTKTPESGAKTALTSTPDEQKAENEKLSSFFANLAKRGVSGSPRNTPGKDARSASGKETPSKKREPSQPL